MRAVTIGLIVVGLVCAGCANKNEKPSAEAEKPFEPQDDYQSPPSYVGESGTTGGTYGSSGDPYGGSTPGGSRPNTVTASEDETLTPAGGRTYVVQKGDTLSSISRKFYGNSGRWKDIYNANKQLTNPNKLPVGAKLAIP